MAERSFKNIGTSITQLQTSRPPVQTFPIGIKTPMELGGNGNPYKMHTTLPEQISDNLRNMILSNHGERLGKYDYGANLQQLLADFANNTDAETAAMQSIMSTVEKYMPFISLDTFEMQYLPSTRNAQAKFQINIGYSVSKIGASNQKLKIILEVIG